MTGPSLHLPDLPEVPVSLGAPSVAAGDAEAPDPAPATPRPRQPLAWRLVQVLSSWLPLFLMALLALGTWWLVRHTPGAPAAPAAAPARQDPDYTMQGFSIHRFGPDGQVALRISGTMLRHYPATDRMEIDGVRIEAQGPDGRSTEATAQRALANGDGTEVQLLGGARVVSRRPGAAPLEVQGEFLHAFLRTERLRSHLPVRVRQGSTTLTAGGLDYDNLQQDLRLDGPVRATLRPGTPRGSDAP